MIEMCYCALLLFTVLYARFQPSDETGRKTQTQEGKYNKAVKNIQI